MSLASSAPMPTQDSLHQSFEGCKICCSTKAAQKALRKSISLRSQTMTVQSLTIILCKARLQTLPQSLCYWTLIIQAFTAPYSLLDCTGGFSLLTDCIKVDSFQTAGKNLRWSKNSVQGFSATTRSCLTLEEAEDQDHMSSGGYGIIACWCRVI